MTRSAKTPVVRAPGAAHTERDDARGHGLAIGQWYWVLDRSDGRKRRKSEWLGCVMEIGSNFVMLRDVGDGGGHSTLRVHLSEVPAVLRPEPDAHAVIQKQIAATEQKLRTHMAAVNAIMARLGVGDRLAIGPPAEAPGHGLATLSGQPNVAAYQQALVRAKDHELPALFQQIKQANEQLAAWMTAETLPMRAAVEQLEGTLGEIDDRIFNVSLYAGLTEQVVCCASGVPAGFAEKLHVMQRRLYMDEECLLNYRHGGMRFAHIEEFDRWLVQPENRDRILPFPRCLVAMRVRRQPVESEWDGSLRSLFVDIDLKEQDKRTFLYIRNGEQVYRLDCDLEFDEMIFPDRAMFDPAEPMMVKISCGRVDQMITVRAYEDRLREHTEIKAMAALWFKEHPKKAWVAANPKRDWHFANPYRHECSLFWPDDWSPFDQTNLYYDECVRQIAERIQQYNRIAVIIQGLFDRSEVLHPHPPVRTWTPDGFAAAITLVYDGSAVLHDGEAPDFEAYRARCNALLDADSVVVGQDHYWQVKEAEKECRRIDRDWRNRSEYRPKLCTPYGNPGPGAVARMAAWNPRTRKATFRWVRDGKGRYWPPRAIPTTLVVPDSALLNVSAYQPGDYQQFFRDPRTRADYLKWAPMLLMAEEYHAGNLEVTV